MKKIVLLRHGQSTWNLENRFTGWIDVDLSERGVTEAREAGRTLKREGYEFDLAFTSYLKRAIRTLWIALEEMDQMWLPTATDWRLNERHYGALQGLNKQETVEKYGIEQVMKWRRGYAVLPPDLDPEDPTHPRFDSRYARVLNPPSTESLSITLERVVPYWFDTVIPALKAGRAPIIVAHGNSIRALIKHLDSISDDEITALNIPTGIPLVYELDDDFNAVKNYYLADSAQLDSALNEVAHQTSASH